MIVWLEKPLVAAIHDRQIAEHGGNGGARDEGLLDSPAARATACRALSHHDSMH